jgi:hypothetical protein
VASWRPTPRQKGLWERQRTSRLARVEAAGSVHGRAWWFLRHSGAREVGSGIDTTVLREPGLGVRVTPAGVMAIVRSTGPAGLSHDRYDADQGTVALAPH